MSRQPRPVIDVGWLADACLVLPVDYDSCVRAQRIFNVSELIVVTQSYHLPRAVATCRRLGVRVISDEIYHGLDYRGASVSALELTRDAIVINSFSKYYCMTGWRIGWMVLPDDLVRRAEILQQNLFISAPTLSQIAARLQRKIETGGLRSQACTAERGGNPPPGRPGTVCRTILDDRFQCAERRRLCAIGSPTSRSTPPPWSGSGARRSGWTSRRAGSSGRRDRPVHRDVRVRMHG